MSDEWRKFLRDAQTTADVIMEEIGCTRGEAHIMLELNGIQSAFDHLASAFDHLTAAFERSTEALEQLTSRPDDSGDEWKQE